MIKRLLSFMGEYKRYAVLSPLCVMAETVCELILPLLMAAMINDGIQGGDLNALWTAGAAMLALSVLSLATGTLSAKYATYAAQGLGANLRKAEFDQINEFSFADIDRFSSASLITRLTNDLTNIQNIVIMGLRILVRCVTMMVVSILMALYLNWRLALIVLVTLPILALFVFGLQRICHPLFQSMQKKIDDLNENVQENLVAIRVVKAFVRQDFERKKFKTANDNFTEAGLKAVLRIVLMQPIMMMGITIATALVMWNGGRMVMDGSLLVGDLSAFNNYIFQILFSVQMLAMALLQYSRAHACAGRIFEVLDTVPDIRNGGETARQLPAKRGLVEFRDVSFKYQATGTGDDVLTHINFTAQPGQTLAIVGGTGVGKSTLVNLIPRFYDATGGDVLVDGLSVKEYPLEELRNRIGMVLQNNVLFSGTIRENLLWGREEATEAEMIQAAKDAQAYDFIMSFPNGFDTRLDQGGVNVSGGQKQRLCIARAMLRQPSILILDDSTSAVDSATEAAIRESFHENLKDTTVILIAQRISSVRSADQILVLDDGTVAAMGTHSELMKSSPIYQEIYWSQQEGVSE
ncbi:MAG: ABC transporter ATP-binding protein [Oscillospiraceae bacterium]|nr:ABC transporter ATP-binding protein [Oscillospiraceae bacterium]